MSELSRSDFEAGSSDLGAVLDRFSPFCSRLISVSFLHPARGRGVAADQIADVKRRDRAVFDHPFAGDHHPVRPMRATQNERGQWIAVAGKAQFVERSEE